MIRKLQKKDLPQVMQIWLAGNIEAHPFIPKAYWRDHFDAVAAQLPQADVFVFEKDGKIVGFIGLVDNYVAGLFVEKNSRSQGIGRQLLDYAKGLHESLKLHVYEQNERAVEFYKREGFVRFGKDLDRDTNAAEYLMAWQK